MTDDELIPQKRSAGKYILIGCLTVFLLFAAVVGGGAIYVYYNWRHISAIGGRYVLDKAMKNAELPEAQKLAVQNEINAFIDSVESGDVTPHELKNVAEQIKDGPLLPMIMVGAFGNEYIDSSGLSDDEKAQARYQLNRAERGISEGTIPITDIDNILDPLRPDPGEKTEARVSLDRLTFSFPKPEYVDDDELHQFIANAKAAADEAGVPDEKYTIDYAAEVKKVIETAVGHELPKSGP